METDWAENRAKIPQDAIRAVLGKVLDSVYSTGERDKFRTRVERTPSRQRRLHHAIRGMVEVYNDVQQGARRSGSRVRPIRSSRPRCWRACCRSSAAKPPRAVTPAAAAGSRQRAEPAARARLLDGQPGADAAGRRQLRPRLAPRRPGARPQRLHRRGPRPRAGPVLRALRRPGAGRQGGAELLHQAVQPARTTRRGPVRYRVSVKAEGNASIVTVLDNQGAPEKGEAGQRIVTLLLDDLK